MVSGTNLAFGVTSNSDASSQMAGDLDYHQSTLSRQDQICMLGLGKPQPFWREAARPVAGGCRREEQDRPDDRWDGSGTCGALDMGRDRELFPVVSQRRDGHPARLVVLGPGEVKPC